jgi:cardiolipin synthase
VSEAPVSIVVTGAIWMGSGIGSIESALNRLFREAEQEIILVAYAFGSGADLPFDLLETALNRGVQVRLIVNHLNAQPPEAISRLLRYAAIYPHLELYDFASEEGADLHAKFVVADRRLALVGSSNLSRRGLLTNYEMAVLLEGEAAADAARAADLLCTDRHAVRVGTAR